MRVISRRPGPLRVVLTLPPDCRILASFPDDRSVRDITDGCPDLLLQLLLEPPASPDEPAPAAPDDEALAVTVDLSSGSWDLVGMALEEPSSGRSEQIPSERVPLLLSAALAAALAQALGAPARPSLSG